MTCENAECTVNSPGRIRTIAVIVIAINKSSKQCSHYSILAMSEQQKDSNGQILGSELNGGNIYTQSNASAWDIFIITQFSAANNDLLSNEQCTLMTHHVFVNMTVQEWTSCVSTQTFCTWFEMACNSHQVFHSWADRANCHSESMALSSVSSPVKRRLCWQNFESQDRSRFRTSVFDYCRTKLALFRSYGV